jgi:hypothetical protein
MDSATAVWLQNWSLSTPHGIYVAEPVIAPRVRADPLAPRNDRGWATAALHHRAAPLSNCNQLRRTSLSERLRWRRFPMNENISKEDIVVFVGLGGLFLWTYVFLPLVFFHS